MTTRIRESVPKKIAITLVGAIVITLGALWLSSPARAETGPHQHLDLVCYNSPAFASSGPVVIIRNDVRQERKFTQPLVGLRAQNAYCSGPDFISPPDYGSGPELVP